MANTAAQLCAAAIASAGGTLYTSTGVVTILKSFDVCNTTGVVITVRIHIVPQGGSAGADNALYYDFPIAPNTQQGHLGWEGEQVMPANSFLYCKASASGLCILASGITHS
jgi:hypothetical protein